MTLKKGDTSSDWNTIAEPQSPANENERPTYPYNNVLQTESGHSFEMDDTVGRERIRIHHRSNTFIEMHSNGDEVHKIYGDGYEIVLKNKKVLVKGSCTVVVEGNAALEVKGDAFSKIHGNSTQLIKGNSNITCEGDTSISSDKEITLTTENEIQFNCKKVRLYSDLHVTGDITCGQSISCDGNLSAGWDVIGNLSPPKIGVPVYPVRLCTHIHFDPFSAVTGPPVPFT